MKIRWICCRSYGEAKDFREIIYLHVWAEKPFYWGKASSFAARYNYSYRHWIEGCLRHGGALYVGQLDDEAFSRIDEVENYLIRKYPSEMNKRVLPPVADITIEHEGEIPPPISLRVPAVAATRRS
jgi:hypothetical protein